MLRSRHSETQCTVSSKRRRVSFESVNTVSGVGGSVCVGQCQVTLEHLTLHPTRSGAIRPNCLHIQHTSDVKAQLRSVSSFLTLSTGCFKKQCKGYKSWGYHANNEIFVRARMTHYSHNRQTKRHKKNNISPSCLLKGGDTNADMSLSHYVGFTPV